MRIKVSDGTNTIIYELNETSVATSLYQMLPIEVAVQNYSNNEKIFYPLRLSATEPTASRATARLARWPSSRPGATW